MTSRARRRRRTTEPIETRTQKGAQTRARMIDAAKRVFERDGLANSRIQDISEEAGLSYGVFYHYFTSKEDLFVEVAEQQEISLLAALRNTGEPIPDPVERIRAVNRRYLTEYRRESGIMGVIEAAFRQDDRIREVRIRHHSKMARRIAASIETLQQEGHADPELDPWYTANALGYMVDTDAEDFLVHDGDYDFETVVDQLTRLWVNAIGLRTTE